MKYKITIRGDWNDADYLTKTEVVDYYSNCFEYWEELKPLNITYEDFFVAFGEVLSEYTKTNRYNWTDEHSPKVLELLIKKLELPKLVTTVDLFEWIDMYIPGSWEYELHTIHSIDVTPLDKIVSLFNSNR